jgi:hypothetical protein
MSMSGVVERSMVTGIAGAGVAVGNALRRPLRKEGARFRIDRCGIGAIPFVEFDHIPGVRAVKTCI